MAEKHWNTISPSRFPWEQEALDFIHAGFPAADNYIAWSNFEFVADDGSINEVDLLIACPQGIFLIELKSWPGTVSGDAHSWVREFEGKRKSIENPLLLANRKAKRLKSLLLRQRAFRKNGDCPFIEPLVFLSNEKVQLNLQGAALNGLCLRDVGAQPGQKERAGILGAIRRRVCPGLRIQSLPVVQRPVLRTFAQAMEQASIRPRQKDRRVGDFVLDRLVFESTTGAYQDWLAHHVTHASTQRIARIFQVAAQAGGEEREVLRTAARREYEVLERLDHAGVLRADPPTESELGPVLFLRADPSSLRLDQFMQLHGATLAIDYRLAMLRQIADVIRYAHDRHILHRSLSPQCIYVRTQSDKSVLIQVCNWQTSARLSGSTTSQGTRISATLHAGQLVEEASLAYLAPEALSGGADGGPELDVFSLGAIAYLLFTGKPPAASQAELQEKLRAGSGLDIKECLDGAVDALCDLVKFSANANVTLRSDISEFLEKLEEIEDQLTRPEIETVNPLQALKGNHLENGFQVIKKLGAGATALAFLVERQQQQSVLKVARSVDLNARIRAEFELLKSISWPQIVSAHDFHEFGDLRGFTMENAGDLTLAQQLRREGALDLTMLKQFGEDLLNAVQHLDQRGILHRDIKPENIGVRMGRSRKRKELCLFDFSLAGTPPENVRVGTPPYLDPFVGERKVKRWDTSSELFAVAMTLHEMATGLLPKWGDGRTENSLTEGEVRIVGELFPSQLRDRFATFFKRALKRNYSERFDNPAEMLAAWTGLFETMDQPSRPSAPVTEHEDGTTVVLPDGIGRTTQLVLLGLSTRLSNALDRLKLDTVGDLLHYPLRKIYRLPGVGNKTRRELGELCKQLRERLPSVQVDRDPGSPETSGDVTLESVDVLAQQVVEVSKGDAISEQLKIVRAFLEWDPSANPDVGCWPAQSELANTFEVTRQRIGQAITGARKRWLRFPTFTKLRGELVEMLDSLGGVATHQELIAGVLTRRGSALDDPECRRMASISLRACVEAEKGMVDPRFDDYRSSDHIFIARHYELKVYAAQLGKRADEMAAANPLPSAPQAIELLRGVPFPSLPLEIPPPSDNRLLQLAAAASDIAALSSRLELYPKGLSAERALALAQGALACPLEGTLSVEEIRQRVAARYPEASPLPDHPELSRLLEGLTTDLYWDDTLGGGQGAYVPRRRESLTYQSSPSLSSRLSTQFTIQPGAEVPPEIVDARSLEEKLRYSDTEGSFLILSVEPQWLSRAREELIRRYPLSVCDLDEVFLAELKDQAAKRNARWDIVLRADASAPSSTDWRNLQRLVDAALPKVEAALRASGKTRLVVNPGLLARYDRLNLLAQVAQDVGRTNGIHGLWILVPANDQSPLPLLNQKPIPVTNPAQHARITEAWLLNRHRATLLANNA